MHTLYTHLKPELSTLSNINTQTHSQNDRLFKRTSNIEKFVAYELESPNWSQKEGVGKEKSIVLLKPNKTNFKSDQRKPLVTRLNHPSCTTVYLATALPS